MPLKIIRQDITLMDCDAIVNATDTQFSHGGGVDAAIHEAAGEELYRACLECGALDVGGAIITDGFALPCKYVIHTVGPIWRGGMMHEEVLLRSCYTECLKLALKSRCDSIAFPLISSGTFGFPKERVLKVAVEAISEFLFGHEMQVYIVVYDKTAYSISERLFSDITAYIDDVYADMKMPMCDLLRESRTYVQYSRKNAKPPKSEQYISPQRHSYYEIDAPSEEYDSHPVSLDDMLENMDRGFAETLFYYIDKKGMSDVECYKRANVDKKTFSKIKCNKGYRPSKVTAVSFAIALRLSLEETNHLLNTVGMSLSRSSKFDVIIEYFITTGNYKDIFDVNETLYQFDQLTLGC